jgi:hypothetical protein
MSSCLSTGRGGGGARRLGDVGGGFSFPWPAVVARKESAALLHYLFCCLLIYLRCSVSPLPLFELAAMEVAVSVVDVCSSLGAIPQRIIGGLLCHPVGLHVCRAAALTYIGSVRRRLPALRLQVVCPRRRCRKLTSVSIADLVAEEEEGPDCVSFSSEGSPL